MFNWEKIYSYLTDNNDEDKKAKKKYVIKKELKSEAFKSFSKTNQFGNKRNRLEKNKIDVDVIKERNKQFIKNSKLILSSPQRFRSKRHILFVEKVNKIEYAYGTSKDVVYETQKISCKNVIKQYKK